MFSKFYATVFEYRPTRTGTGTAFSYRYRVDIGGTRYQRNSWVPGIDTVPGYRYPGTGSHHIYQYNCSGYAYKLYGYNCMHMGVCHCPLPLVAPCGRGVLHAHRTRAYMMAGKVWAESLSPQALRQEADVSMQGL